MFRVWAQREGSVLLAIITMSLSADDPPRTSHVILWATVLALSSGSFPEAFPDHLT